MSCEGNDSMPQQVDNVFVDDQNTKSQQLLGLKKIFFGLIHLVMVGMMDVIFLWVNTLRAKKI